MAQAKDIVDRTWNSIEAHDLRNFDTLLTPNGEVTMPGGVRLQGPEQLKPLMQSYLDAFSDLRHEIVNVVESADGNKVAVELRVLGTHTGTMRTPTGDIPATGKPVVWDSVDVITVREGKIQTWHTYFDQLAFLSQLDLIPSSAPAGA